MNHIAALMVSQAFAEEHRRSAVRRRRRQAQQARASTVKPHRRIAWPFRLPLPNAARTGA